MRKDSRAEESTEARYKSLYALHLNVQRDNDVMGCVREFGGKLEKFGDVSEDFSARVIQRVREVRAVYETARFHDSGRLKQTRSRSQRFRQASTELQAIRASRKIIHNIQAAATSS